MFLMPSYKLKLLEFESNDQLNNKECVPAASNVHGWLCWRKLYLKNLSQASKPITTNMQTKAEYSYFKISYSDQWVVFNVLNKKYFIPIKIQ